MSSDRALAILTCARQLYATKRIRATADGIEIIGYDRAKHLAALVHDQGSCCASGGRSWHW
jgi:hypothetical protein